MAITLEIFEDSGTQTGSPLKGTTRIQVDNIGWKASGLDETFTFADYPIVRPELPQSASFSFHKYNFVKISGTYPLASRLQATLVGDTESGSLDGLILAGKVRLYYKWTNVYNTPTNAVLSGSLYDPNQLPIWRPMFSSVGPESATSKLNTMVANTTYYSSYLVTQLYVEPSLWTEYGNLGDLKMQFDLHEYENTDI